MPLKTQSYLESAVHNNAVWCDTVCRSHGRPGEFLETIWVNWNETPPYYPNGDTLVAVEPPDAQLAAIRDLIDAGLTGSWAVKDSFCTLDLTPYNFRVLFEASWVVMTAPRAQHHARPIDIQWTTVTEPGDLENWERAWAKELNNGQGSGQRIFLPTLLDDDVAFIAASRGTRIVAGAIANRTGDVIGLTNIFAPSTAARSYWAGCIAVATELFPGLALVGYENGESLAIAESLGFDVIAPLRVWLKQPN